MDAPQLGRLHDAIGTTTLDRSRRRSWLLPLLLFVAVLIAGGWSISTLDSALRKDAAEELETLLNADVKALSLWIESHERAVRLLAQAPSVRTAVRSLIREVGEGSSVDDLRRSPSLAAFRTVVGPVARAHDHAAFSVILPNGLFLATGDDAEMGVTLPSEGMPFLRRALDGETVFVPPFRSEKDRRSGRVQSPSSALMHPILDASRAAIGVLAVRFHVETFSEILSIAQAGETGETYAFNQAGLLVSKSRFEPELRRMGLLPTDPSTSSVLNVAIRNPGGPLPNGHVPRLAREAQPLTRMAASATSGQNGVDVEGYRDYRGVLVIGAWRWFDEYGIGVATEVDSAEAFATLHELAWVLGVLCVLLLMCAGIYFHTSRRVHGLREKVSAAQQLGQYTIESKIGAGAMGTVYRARHAMLRRPTAVKVLSAELATDAALARFEREVQMTSQLTHPNTIAVYDYGRSADGTFFYAMEYLAGMSLEQLVMRYGPQPPARVIHILRQACGSLGEAHGVGLIHRDVKPANIMLLARGGLHDVVKVLDFGLVKETQNAEAANVTQTGSIMGTPFYLSPETIRTPTEVDARSDLYALGAVGYYLLTGTRVFQGTTIGEILAMHLQATPELPSVRLGAPVPVDLETVLLSCLEKEADQRPETAAILMSLLDGVGAAGTWGQEDAKRWWDQDGTAPEGLVRAS